MESMNCKFNWQALFLYGGIALLSRKEFSAIVGHKVIYSFIILAQNSSDTTVRGIC